MNDDMNDFTTIATEKVAEFIKAFDASHDVNLWIKLVMEEGAELLDATDPENELKEAADFAYVTAGMCQATGASERKFSRYENVVWDAACEVFYEVRDKVGEDNFREAFNRVHLSNMSKLGEDGKPVRREDGKVLKGPNYAPPVLSDLI